jgi:hypothetical protein
MSWVHPDWKSLSGISHRMKEQWAVKRSRLYLYTDIVADQLAYNWFELERIKPNGEKYRYSKLGICVRDLNVERAFDPIASRCGQRLPSCFHVKPIWIQYIPPKITLSGGSDKYIIHGVSHVPFFAPPPCLIFWGVWDTSSTISRMEQCLSP